MKFFDELKRRNVVKETLAYLVVAWIILQVASIVLPLANAPDWVLKTLIFFLVLGLPFWVFFSWAYQVTPEGFKKTARISVDEFNNTATNKRLNIIIIVALILAIALSFFYQPTIFDSSNTNTGTNLLADNSIAVLPFVNMSGDVEQEYFADGLSEELINMFTKLPELRVIGRTSSFAFKGKSVDLRSIGTKLNVNYILEGSVRKSGEKIRITAQLIQTKDGSHLWSHTFDRNLVDIFKIQDEISAEVANALSVTLIGRNSNPKDKHINSEAYNYFLKGKFHYESSRSSLEITNATDEALKWFNKAIEVDSTFSLAWTYRGMCYWRKSSNSLSGNFIEAKAASLKAFDLDPSSGIAAVNLAEILDNEYNFLEALKYVELAVQLEPYSPYVLRNAGRFYTILGREKESIEFCERALENDPIQGTALSYLLKSFYYSEQYPQVYQLILENKDQYPGIMFAYESISVLALDNLSEEYLEEFIKEDPPKSSLLYFEALRAHNTKNKTDALEKVAQIVTNHPHQSYIIALAYAFIGENSKAIDWLEKSFASKDKIIVHINVEPKFDVIRDSTRFKDLINKMNFPK